MSSNAELAASVRKLMEQEPSLAKELDECENLTKAAELVVAAASHSGMALAHDAVTNLLQAAAFGRVGEELNEEQLAGVQGGIRPSTILFDPKLQRHRR